MNYRLTEIEERVYALLDENRDILVERVEYGDPGVALPTLIRMLLPDSARCVLLSASLDEISECVHMDSVPGLTRGVAGNLFFTAPDDFLRLVWLRMSDWSVGVRTPLATGSEEYAMRFSRRPGLSRPRRSPAVALRRQGDRASLEVFGSVPGARVVEFDYIAVPRIRSENIDIPESMMPEVCAHLARAIRDILGREWLDQ